jgi:transcriptional regulator with XRE-family HTH domain
MTVLSRKSANDSATIAAQCARQLLELRGRTGETQRALAQRLAMTESMISRLERGDHVPSLKTLCRIADVFGRRLEIVFHEHQHTHPDGTRHSHPHSHLDPDHRHPHADGHDNGHGDGHGDER